LGFYIGAPHRRRGVQVTTSLHQAIAAGDVSGAGAILGLQLRQDVRNVVLDGALG
jgi:hypothetical protein